MVHYVYNVSYYKNGKKIFSEDFGSIYDCDNFVDNNASRGKYNYELAWSTMSGSKRIYIASINNELIKIISEYTECNKIRSRVCRLQYLHKRDRKKAIENIKALI